MTVPESASASEVAPTMADVPEIEPSERGVDDPEPGRLSERQCSAESCAPVPRSSERSGLGPRSGQSVRDSDAGAGTGLLAAVAGSEKELSAGREVSEGAAARPEWLEEVLEEIAELKRSRARLPAGMSALLGLVGVLFLLFGGVVVQLVDGTSKQIGRLDDKIDRLDDKIDSTAAALDGKIDALEDKIDGKIAALDAKIDAAVERLDAKIDALAAEVADISETLAVVVAVLNIGREVEAAKEREIAGLQHRPADVAAP